jgi:hypothetical protein
VNRQVTDFEENASFEKSGFAKSKPIEIKGMHFRTSKVAHLHCGETNAGDVIGLTNGRLAKVVMFWQLEEFEALVQIELYTQSKSSLVRWSTANSTIEFARTADIVAAVPWAAEPPHEIRCCMPIGFFLRQKNAT